MTIDDITLGRAVYAIAIAHPMMVEDFVDECLQDDRLGVKDWDPLGKIEQSAHQIRTMPFHEVQDGGADDHFRRIGYNTRIIIPQVKWAAGPLREKLLASRGEHSAIEFIGLRIAVAIVADVA